MQVLPLWFEEKFDFSSKSQYDSRKKLQGPFCRFIIEEIH